ncbi:HAD family phosphatase [uncultured Ruegeria sp.]|uniref:HAD family hydrolase n=1 Tax=uncultured Ruegeria sp. TaxID=259304 RepID=UPI002615967E|nr:beta-phosphoglucomutase family hydrolase [uncultured Ruegeria sp.]
MPIKGLIFDLDGVLVDTVPAHFAAWKRMFEEYGYEFGKPEYRHLVDGRPRYDGARAVMTQHSDEEVRTAADKKNDYYVEMIERGEFRVFDAAVHLVKQCQSKAYGLAAASSSANVRAVLEKAGLLDAFPVIIGGDDIEKGKPNPDIFLAAAGGLGLNVDECVVIEDSKSGVEAAKNGGFFCVGLLHEDHESELSAADCVISSLTEFDIEQFD